MLTDDGWKGVGGLVEDRCIHVLESGGDALLVLDLRLHLLHLACLVAPAACNNVLLTRCTYLATVSFLPDS